MTAATTQPSGIFQDIWKGIQTGGMIMLVQTPVVTAMNRISVVSCFRNLSTIQSISHIYRGTMDSSIEPSLVYFLTGVSGHLVKGLARQGFGVSC